jgi:glycosyltransferase involved in cell wall biosynthesis
MALTVPSIPTTSLKRHHAPTMATSPFKAVPHFSPVLPAEMLAGTMVIIPALNEEMALPGVLRDLRALGLRRVRVVDNGSADRTPEVARELGADVHSEPVRGYGAACWRGMADLGADVTWVLFCDADGSDDLSELPSLFGAAAAGAEFALGDRRASAEGRATMTPQQNFGNALATLLIRLGWRHRYRDLGPLRLISRPALDRIAMRDRGFGWTVEMQIRAIEEGICTVEVPVGYRRRQGGRSKISGTILGSVRAGTVILSTVAKLWLHRWFGRSRQRVDS